MLVSVRLIVLTIIISLLFVITGLIYSCSNDSGGNKFVGRWKERETYVEITKSGDYYQWNDGGNLFGKLQLKYVDGELQSGGLEGNVRYNKDNGHIYFFGREFAKEQEK